MLRVYILLTLVVGLAGCGKEIGDDCLSDAECGPSRTCDKASFGGYCTVNPCAEGTCPEGAVCVTFLTTETFCMAACEDGGDCRDGYQCKRESGVTPYCRQSP